MTLKPPGLLVRNYGRLTPAGLLPIHIAYGLVVGLVHGWLVD